jgi:hypothetical protein
MIFQFAGKVGPIEPNLEDLSQDRSASLEAANEVNKLLAHFNRPENSYNAVIAFEVFSLCRKHKFECPPELLDFIAHVGGEIVVAAKNSKRRRRNGGENTKDTYTTIIHAISNSVPKVGKDSVLQNYSKIIESTEELLSDEETIEIRYQKRMKEFWQSTGRRDADDLESRGISSVMRSQYKAAVYEVLPPAENGSNRRAQLYLEWRKQEGRDILFNALCDSYDRKDEGPVINEIDLG